MNPQAGKLAFGMAIFVLILSGAMLPFQERGTPEYTVTVITFVLAILFAALVVLMARRSR